MPAANNIEHQDIMLYLFLFLIVIVFDPYLDIARINKKTRIKKPPYKKIVSNLIDNIV